jgi:hypothetical protein
LLRKNREIRKNTTAVTEYWLRKQACLHGNNWKRQKKNDLLCAVGAEMLQTGLLEQ